MCFQMIKRSERLEENAKIRGTKSYQYYNVDRNPYVLNIQGNFLLRNQVL